MLTPRCPLIVLGPGIIPDCELFQTDKVGMMTPDPAWDSMLGEGSLSVNPLPTSASIRDHQVRTAPGSMRQGSLRQNLPKAWQHRDDALTRCVDPAITVETDGTRDIAQRVLQECNVSLIHTCLQS